MAELIDITDFGGVVTNVDVEDLPEHIAQNMENLRIRDGKLEKTFGAGQPSSVPNFALSQLNTKLSKSYVVYNLFTFISDKFATQEHRYILVLIDSSTKEALLFWYDPSQPAVSDHLQIEDNILFFETASDSGHAQSANVMVVDVKDNSGSAIAGTDIYDDIDYKTGNKHYVNTNNASTWGGSFFATSGSTGCRVGSVGGKHSTHLNVTDNASNNISSFKRIASLALNGKVLCLYSYLDSKDKIRYSIGTGSTTVALDVTKYNLYQAYTSLYVASMCNYNNGIYVHYSGVTGSPSANKNHLIKYTVETNGDITETVIQEDFHTTNAVTESYMYEAGDGNLYLLNPGVGLYKITSSGISAVAGEPSNTGSYSWVGITSITNTVSGSKEYLVLAESDSSNHKFHFSDILAGTLDGSSTWADTGVLTNQLHMVSKMHFNENSGKNESIVKYMEKGDGSKYVQHSTHNDGTVILSWADIHSSTFTTSTVVTFLKHAYRNPSGVKYLIVGTNDFTSGSPTVIQHGRVYRVPVDKTPLSMNNHANDTFKGWNPTCFDDVVTGFSSGNYFFEHAKAYMMVYGVECVELNNDTRAQLNRFTDIGWGSGSWGGSGSCDYKWTNLNDKYTIGAHYHKAQRNPIVPFSDSIRVLPGDIATVGSNSANGIWLGYIDRKLMNEGVTIAPGFYAYSNVLTNSFTISDDMGYIETTDELRDSDEIRYNVTAVFDGTQETLLEESKEQVAISVAGSGVSPAPTVVDISKSKIIIPIDIDFATINKRITGFNLYRANRYNGVWETYKKIQEFNFIREAETQSTTDKFMEMHYNTDHTVYIYDSNGYLSHDSSANLTAINSDEGSYALKVGGNWKRKLTQDITPIQGYALTGAELSADITSSATTNVAVTNASSLSNGTDYFLGTKTHSSLVNSGGSSTNDDEPVERVTVSSINTSANTVTLTRAQGSPATTATEHKQYTEFRSITATNTNWYMVKVNKAFTATRWNSSWSFYRKLGSSWDRQDNTGGGNKSSVHSSGAYGSHKAGFMIPLVSPNSAEDNIDFDSWRDASSHDITTTGLAGNYIETDDNGVFKISDVSTYNAHGNFFHFKSNKNLPAGNGFDEGKLGGTLTIKNTATNKYTIKITDDGLTSLGEHWGEAVVSTRVNGRYAKMVKSRLFLGNIFLDIGDENEERNDWVAYSEINQFDTRPVSNVIQFDDREGGAITGLAEIFGRLVVFKPQAIFILNLSDPVNPSSWSIVESKHNIGNVAFEGMVEVHDSIYFVYHDGIYRITSNMSASSTATPTVMDKVTDAIDDQFMLATDKTAIKGIFDSERQEIIYKWMVSSTQVVWAYNYVKQTWRKIDMGTGVLDLLAYDENGSPMDYDKTNNKIIKFDTANASTSKWKSKKFPLDLHRKRLLRYGTVQFVGTDTLTYNLYLDGAGSASFTKSITADGGIVRFPIKRYAKKFEIELSTASSTNAFTLERLQIEME